MTGSEDTSVVFHEGPPFKFMKSCQNAHTNFVNAVAFSPDGSRAFSCGSDGIVAVYSGDAGELLTVLNPKLSCSIWGIAPGIRGEVFAACGDKKIRSITGETCELINELVVGEGELKDMPLGITSDISMNTVTCITFDGTVRQFTVGENSELIPKSSLIGSSGPISAIIAQKDVVYVTSVDGSIWTLAKPFISGAISKINPKKPIKGSAGLIVDLMEVLGVSATQNELINIKTGDVKKIPIPNMTQRLVACKPVGYAIGDRSLKLSQIHQPCKSFEIPDSSESIGAFGVSLDGEVIVVAPHKDRSGMDQSGREILINMRTRIKTTITGSDIVNIAVNPDGSLIAVASGAHDIHVYKREGQGNSCNYVLIPETAKVWNYHRSRIACMQWADKTSLVTGGLDKNIYVWDVDRAISGPVTSLKDQHKEGVSALFASRDNGALHIVSGGNEGCVRVNIV
jgi:WD40 repeat protein